MAAQPGREIFEDKCNEEDLWKAVFFVGTKLNQLDAIYNSNWDFSNLQDAFKEGGRLYGKKVYLFGCTEPRVYLYLEPKMKVLWVPVVVAVDSPSPPSDKIGTNYIGEAEEIVPMEELKLEWVPYTSLVKSQVFVLSCSQDRDTCCPKKYEDYQPYLYRPPDEDELKLMPMILIDFPDETKPVICYFDWEFDEVDEFADELIEEGRLDKDRKDAFKDFVEERVGEGKKAYRQAREACKKAAEEAASEEGMRFYKFYPVNTPDTLDGSKKVPFINRFYGTAHEVL